jgi:hypothetical protein
MLSQRTGRGFGCANPGTGGSKRYTAPADPTAFARALYVASRNQAKALTATLELEGVE